MDSSNENILNNAGDHCADYNNVETANQSPKLIEQCVFHFLKNEIHTVIKEWYIITLIR